MTDRTNRLVKKYCAELYGLAYIVLGILGLSHFFGIAFFKIFSTAILLTVISMIVIVVVTKRLKKLWVADVVTVLFDWVLDLAGSAGLFYLTWHVWHWQLIVASLAALIALTVTRWLRRLNPDVRKWSELLQNDLPTEK